MASPLTSAVILRPQFELRVCPFCGMPCEFKFDKKNRPYVHCQNCWTRVFIYTPTGLTGLQMMQDSVFRYGPGRWATEVARRVMAFIKRVGGYIVMPGASAMHRLLPPTRSARLEAAVTARPIPSVPRR